MSSIHRGESSEERKPHNDNAPNEHDEGSETNLQRTSKRKTKMTRKSVVKKMHPLNSTLRRSTTVPCNATAFRTTMRRLDHNYTMT